MRAEVADVVLGAMDETRLSPAHEVEPEHVETRSVDDAAVVTQRGPCGRTRAPAASADPGGSRSPRESCRCGLSPGRASAADSPRGASPRIARPGPRAEGLRRQTRTGGILRHPAIDRIEQAPELEIRHRAVIRERPGELRLGRPGCRRAGRPARTPRSVSAFRSSVARSGVPTSCGDGTRRARTMSSTSS